ncbi:MAG: type II toxin-antitoxin system RelE/ParE family toxin [Burkholderiales bacterium]|nr:type II toxin-antitoxin system RelE/ParE family toxin [Burkholderiales bacterium]
MIRSFADAATEHFYATGRSRHFPPELCKRAAMRRTQLNAAMRPDDLRSPPSNRLGALKGDRKGQWRIRIHDQWPVRFRFEKGETFEVEIVVCH